MAILNTSATNKTQITVDYPDSGDGYITAVLLSHLAIGDDGEMFQGGTDKPVAGQVYQCNLDASGNVDSTDHASGWFLPTPDQTGDAGWLYRFYITDSAGNLRHQAKATVAYSASSQSLSSILAAGIADSDPDAVVLLLADYLLLAGGTMTGQLNFDGTDHAGIKLVSLTEAQRDALTAVNGMVIYNETEGKVQSYQSGAWVSIGVASAPALDDVSDVTLSSPADKEMLTYDSGTGQWINRTAAENDLATDDHNHDADYEAAGTVAAHEADTTNIHGIADTSQLATLTNLGNHESDTTNIHGIADTANLLDTADIGVTVQAHDADTAKLDTAQNWSAAQNLQDNELTRPKLRDYGETVNSLGDLGGGTDDIDLTLGNVVTATVSTAEQTFTFSNPPASGTAGSFTLIGTNMGSQTVNWPASVQWAGGEAPTLTAAGIDILTFITVDGGTTWMGFAAGLDMS